MSVFEYFAGIANTLGCTALWWDAISLPMDPDKRSRAIANIHTHYAKTSCTIIHDKFLVDFPWDDDGGALPRARALILVHSRLDSARAA